METCVSGISLLVFFAQCFAAAVAGWSGYAVGWLFASRVSQIRLEAMAEKLDKSWLVFWALCLSLLAAIAVGLGSALYLEHIKHLSQNVFMTVALVVGIGLAGVFLGLAFNLRDRVDALLGNVGLFEGW